MPEVRLDATDAAELGEMLQFLSQWLSRDPARLAAEWAGHSVDVLLRIYAKCIAGQDELAKRRISEALRGG